MKRRMVGGSWGLEAGGRALRYLQTIENVARMKLLLDDPEWSCMGRVEENGGVEIRYFGVRAEAYKT